MNWSWVVSAALPAGRLLAPNVALTGVGEDESAAGDRDGVTGPPETYFIDRAGRVVSKKVSPITSTELESLLAAIP